MGSVRLALIWGGVAGALFIGACGLEAGGPGEDPDSGMEPDVAMMPDASMDIFMLPDAPMDIMTPDLGTGETESGALCTCTPALPSGWAFVSWQETARPACPMGYDSPNNTVSTLSWQPMTCSCTEAQAPQTAPTCTGNTSFAIGFDKTGSCNTTTDTITCGACTALNKTYNAGGGDFTYFSANGSPTPVNGMCAAPQASTTKPNATWDQGRYCKLKGAPGTCGGGACVTTPTGGDGICIYKTGFQATCPAGFPNTHYVGDNVFDNRSCGNDPCNGTKVTLTPGSCSKPTFGLYSDNKCMSQLFAPQVADNTCVNEGTSGNSLSFMSCGYTSTNSGASCAYTGTFTPQGGVVLTPLQTICCL